MALSQIGEYVEDINELAPVVKVALTFLGITNPKIRWAACHCFGQLADDLYPDFGN